MKRALADFFRNPVCVAALLLSLAFISGASILGRSWVRVRTLDEQIRVFGSARRQITSDLILWNVSFAHTGTTPPQAFAALKADEAKVRAYLLKAGVPAGEISASAIASETIYVKPPPLPKGTVPDPNSQGLTYAQKIAAYKFSESLSIESKNVALIDDLSRRSTELLSQGLDFESATPSFLYTQLAQLKVTMQAEAAADALARAQQIAQKAGCRLGSVRYARMSTPSITPALSTSDDDGGVDDTTSLQKRITAIVSVGYGIR